MEIDKAKAKKEYSDKVNQKTELTLEFIDLNSEEDLTHDVVQWLNVLENTIAFLIVIDIAKDRSDEEVKKFALLSARSIIKRVKECREMIKTFS